MVTLDFPPELVRAPRPTLHRARRVLARHHRAEGDDHLCVRCRQPHPCLARRQALRVVGAYR